MLTIAGVVSLFLAFGHWITGPGPTGFALNKALAGVGAILLVGGTSWTALDPQVPTTDATSFIAYLR